VHVLRAGGSFVIGGSWLAKKIIDSLRLMGFPGIANMGFSDVDTFFERSVGTARNGSQYKVYPMEVRNQKLETSGGAYLDWQGIPVDNCTAINQLRNVDLNVTEVSMDVVLLKGGLEVSVNIGESFFSFCDPTSESFRKILPLLRGEDIGARTFVRLLSKAREYGLFYDVSGLDPTVGSLRDVDVLKFRGIIEMGPATDYVLVNNGDRTHRLQRKACLKHPPSK